jgi:hypothetical protein
MKPEVEEELNKIGWRMVERLYPFVALSVRSAMSQTGGNLAKNGKAARTESRRIRTLVEHTIAATRGFSELSEIQRGIVNVASTKVEDREFAIPDHVNAASEGLLAIEEGLLDLLAFLEFEGEKNQIGRPVNEAARSLCEHVSIVYVLHFGERPSIGRLADGGGVSGKYGRVCEKIMKSLDMKVADAYRPCLGGIERISDNRFQNLLIKRRPFANFHRAAGGSMAKGG